MNTGPYSPTNLTIGDRLVPDTERAIQASSARASAIVCARLDCPGCGPTLAARTVVDAALAATEGRLTVITVSACFKPSSGAPATAVFREAPPLIPDVLAAIDAAERPLLVQADNAEIGTMQDRNVLMVRYEGTTDRIEREGFDVAKVAAAFRYVATATIADITDLERKVMKAMGLKGPRLVTVLAPCPVDCKTKPDEAVRLARLAVETGLFPVVEVDNGKVVDSRIIRHRLPVLDFLKAQGRYADVLKDESDPRPVQWQAIADRNIAAFDLLRKDGRG